MTDYSWIDDYLGKAFQELSYGPDTFDCYGLVWHVSQHQAGVTLPRFDDIEYQAARINAEVCHQASLQDWLKVDQPQDFDVVVLRKAGESNHVGIWLEVDGGKVLHATRRNGVICTDPGALYRMNYKSRTYHRFQA